MILSHTFFFLLVSLLCGTAAASPESDFWKWFQKNEAMLLDFKRENKEEVFDLLRAEMHKVNANLTFDVGPKFNGQRQFVISADGMLDTFPAVERLYAAAPPLKKWKVFKYRQRSEPVAIETDGISVSAWPVSIFVERDGRKAKITVLIPEYTNARRATFTDIAFRLVDMTLGEYDVTTRVGSIDVAAPSKRFAKAMPLRDLPKAFDTLLSK